MHKWCYDCEIATQVSEFRHNFCFGIYIYIFFSWWCCLATIWTNFSTLFNFLMGFKWCCSCSAGCAIKQMPRCSHSFGSVFKSFHIQNSTRTLKRWISRSLGLTLMTAEVLILLSAGPGKHSGKPQKYKFCTTFECCSDQILVLFWLHILFVVKSNIIVHIIANKNVQNKSKRLD